MGVWYNFLMHIPSELEIQNLHKKFAPSEKAYEKVFIHCEIVAEICNELAKHRNDINHELAHAGALLHDIGAYRFINAAGDFFNEEKYIQHGIVGYEMLEDEKYDEIICRFAKAHTGVGITKDEIINNALPLPPEDYLAETIEEKLVMYADKFHSKKPIFHRFETYRTKIEKFSDSSEKQHYFDELAATFGKPNFEAFARRFAMPID